MQRILAEHKTLWSDKKFVLSSLGGFLMIAGSLVAQFVATGYATRTASVPVTDIILSNTRVYDVDVLFIFVTLALFLFGVLLCLRYPQYIPFTVKSVAVFTLIRAVFITLTHINVYPLHSTITSVFFQEKIFWGIFTGVGLFFSGHTGLPFLLALMFWNNKNLRYIFLGFSFLLAVIVLLGHLHYSIDVLSAYFISYAIFHLCIFLFKKDRELFLRK